MHRHRITTFWFVSCLAATSRGCKRSFARVFMCVCLHVQFDQNFLSTIHTILVITVNHNKVYVELRILGYNSACNICKACSELSPLVNTLGGGGGGRERRKIILNYAIKESDQHRS